MEISKRHQLSGVDIFKYVMAFAVIAIHYGDQYPIFFKWFIRLAVPFYFTTSGFLLERTLNTIQNNQEKIIYIRKRCLKIFKLFGMWILIYIPISIYGYLTEHTLPWMIPFEMLFDIIGKGQIVYAWPLWFLYSLGIFTYLIGVSINHPKFKSVILFIIICGYFGQYMIETVDPADIRINNIHLKYILYGLPYRVLSGGMYIMTGIFIYRRCRTVIDNNHSFIPIILLIALSYLLFMFKLPMYEIFGGMSIFLIAARLPIQRASLCLSLRVQSMWLYYTHMYVIFFAIILPNHFGFSMGFDSGYFLVAIVSVLLALGLWHLQQYKTFSFLSSLSK